MRFDARPAHPAAHRRADAVDTVAILCGGRGTRLREHTQAIPKALVEVGGRPILWHIVRIYAAQGFRRAVLCLGHKGEMVAEFARDEPWPEGIEVEPVDTGEDTPTGGRLLAARAAIGEATFCATYGDGVADVDLGALTEFHRAHGATGTMTVVRPQLQFGITDLDGDGRVTGFHEKPRSEHWVNGGFFCFEPALYDVLAPDSVLEREPLEDLAARGELRAFRHEGFWDCMDTYKDAVLLNDLWAQDRAPWKVWA